MLTNVDVVAADFVITSVVVLLSMLSILGRVIGQHIDIEMENGNAHTC